MTNRRSSTAILLVTATLAGSAGYFGARWTQGRDAPQAPTTAAADDAAVAIPVQAVAARRGLLRETVSVYGTVQDRPGDASAVSVPFEAIPRAMHVSVGQAVGARTPLVDLEPSPDARLQLRQAEQAVAAAETGAEQARRRRDEQLATNADVVAAEQTLQAARTQLDAIRAKGVGQAVTLRASEAGIVTAVAAQPGQLAAAATPLVTLSPEGSAQVRVGVDPADAATLCAGDAFTLHVPGSTNTIVATMQWASRVLTPQTRLVDVFLKLDPASGFRAGTFVQADFSPREASGLIVPRAATQLEDEDWCLYVVKEDKAVRHVVTIGPGDGKDVVVSAAGVDAGDLIVVERNGELQDGSAVRVEPADEDEK